MSTTAPSQSPPLSIVFDRIEEMYLNAGQALVLVFSVRNITGQRITFIPTELICLTHDGEKIRSCGFVSSFVTESGESLEPGQSAKVAPAILKVRLPVIRQSDTFTLGVSANELAISQRTTFLCRKTEPIEFAESAQEIGVIDTALSKVAFSAMLQDRIERFELLEERAGVALRGLAVAATMDSSTGHWVTVRGEALKSDAGDNELCRAIQLTAYNSSGGVIDVRRTEVCLTNEKPLAIFELHLVHIVDVPTRLTIYPVSS